MIIDSTNQVVGTKIFIDKQFLVHTTANEGMRFKVYGIVPLQPSNTIHSISVYSFTGYYTAANISNLSLNLSIQLCSNRSLRIYMNLQITQRRATSRQHHNYRSENGPLHYKVAVPLSSCDYVIMIIYKKSQLLNKMGQLLLLPQVILYFII